MPLRGLRQTLSRTRPENTERAVPSGPRRNHLLWSPGLALFSLSRQRNPGRSTRQSELMVANLRQKYRKPRIYVVEDCLPAAPCRVVSVMAILRQPSSAELHSSDVTALRI